MIALPRALAQCSLSDAGCHYQNETRDTFAPDALCNALEGERSIARRPKRMIVQWRRCLDNQHHLPRLAARTFQPRLQARDWESAAAGPDQSLQIQRVTADPFAPPLHALAFGGATHDQPQTPPGRVVQGLVIHKNKSRTLPNGCQSRGS